MNHKSEYEAIKNRLQNVSKALKIAVLNAQTLTRKRRMLKAWLCAC